MTVACVSLTISEFLLLLPTVPLAQFIHVFFSFLFSFWPRRLWVGESIDGQSLSVLIQLQSIVYPNKPSGVEYPACLHVACRIFLFITLVTSGGGVALVVSACC